MVREGWKSAVVIQHNEKWAEESNAMQGQNARNVNTLLRSFKERLQMSWNISYSFAKPSLSTLSYLSTHLPLLFLSYRERVRVKGLIESRSHSFPPQGHVTRVVCPLFQAISLSPKTVVVGLQTTEKGVNDGAGFQALVGALSN